MVRAEVYVTGRCFNIGLALEYSKESLKNWEKLVRSLFKKLADLAGSRGGDGGVLKKCCGVYLINTCGFVQRRHSTNRRYSTNRPRQACQAGRSHWLAKRAAMSHYGVYLKKLAAPDRARPPCRWSLEKELRNLFKRKLEHPSAPSSPKSSSGQFFIDSLL